MKVIKVDKLKKAYKDSILQFYGDLYIPLAILENNIQELNTQIKQRGQWQVLQTVPVKDKCPRCGGRVLHNDPLYLYCPYCGLKMDGGQI